MLAHNLANAFGRVAIAFVVGLVIGNILCSVYTGPLAIGFMIGGVFVAGPLALVAAVVAALADGAIRKKPALWSAAGAVSVCLVYVLIDPPNTRAAVERDILAATCSLVSGLTFYCVTTRTNGSHDGKE